ncbi:MAG: helix-turn-helix domain-containing protein [Planctomycetota bacterium]|jgi:hypothetical protein
MRLEGRLERDGRWWLAEIPVLDSVTQGRTKAEALEMVTDLVETMVDRPGFAAHVHLARGSTFEVSCSDFGALVAILLRRLRARSGLTLAEVAGRLGHTSPNAYARYEQGRTVPTVEKLAELLRAVDCDIVLRESAV